MKAEPLVEIGIVRKTHGYDGELKLAVDPGYRDVVEAATFLFLGPDDAAAIPYEITARRGDGGDIVALVGVDSKEAATPLRGCAVFVGESLVGDTGAPASVSAYDIDAARAYDKFVGFAVIDDDVGEIGAISLVEAYPGQAMASVEHDGATHLVPLTPELIKGVDFTKKIMFMKLPQGLFDL